MRLDHHSAVGEVPVTQRIPLMGRRVACHTSVEATVVPPATTATRRTVCRPIVVVLIVRREFHSIVQPVGVTSVILERIPTEITPHMISIVVVVVIIKSGTIPGTQHHHHRYRRRHRRSDVILERVPCVSAVPGHFQSVFVDELVADLERPVFG